MAGSTEPPKPAGPHRGVVVGICGPIGAGKTTLTPPLAAALGYLALPERPQENVFFERGLIDPGRWAFSAEAMFLVAAADAAIEARGAVYGGVVERPMQETLGVYIPELREAHHLSDDEAHALTKIGRLAEESSGSPDILIMLHGDPGVLWRRIRSRGRPGEAVYDFNHVERLRVRYETWSSGWNACPTIHADATAADLQDDPNIASLAYRVREVIRSRDR